MARGTHTLGLGYGGQPMGNDPHTANSLRRLRRVLRLSRLSFIPLIVAVALGLLMTIFVFNGLKSANANLMVPEVDVPVRFPIHERDEAYLSETSVTVTDAQGIYLYPNAQNVTEEPSYIGAPWRHIIDYDVPVSSEHVLVFYKAQLAKTGWVDGGPSIYGTPSTLYAGFDWLDP